MKKLQGSLSFYGTVGNNEITLEVDRTAPVDLVPYFKKIFHKYNTALVTRDLHSEGQNEVDEWILKKRVQTLDEKIEIKENAAIFPFILKDFYSMMLYKNTPEQLAEFLKQNMKDPEDFHNETLIKKTLQFHEEYLRVSLDYVNTPYFMVKPYDEGLTCDEIEALVPPPLKDKVSRNAREWYIFLKKDKKIEITQPYPVRLENHMERTLRDAVSDKRLIRVYETSTYNFDLFEIIVSLDLPRDNLDIVRRNE